LFNPPGTPTVDNADQKAPRRWQMTDKQQEQLELQARMWDMGQAPKERVVNRVLHKVEQEQAPPTDEKLHELLADESTGENIQDIYG
jgi:hypothetical protein